MSQDGDLRASRPVTATSADRSDAPSDDAPYYVVPECKEQIGIVHQDDDILVIAKPAFLLSVPGRGPENKDCVISRLTLDFPVIHLVHRLDLDTSGLMVFALTQPAQASIARAFQERRVHKEYDAILEGIVEQDSGSIDLPIAPDWSNRPRQKVCPERGKNALTHYRVIKRYPSAHCTHVRLIPITGRSHQLRIHTLKLGHPIIGCDLYAPEEICARSSRLLLHAGSLSFNHPRTGLWQCFTSDAPFLEGGPEQFPPSL